MENGQKLQWKKPCLFTEEKVFKETLRGARHNYVDGKKCHKQNARWASPWCSQP